MAENQRKEDEMMNAICAIFVGVLLVRAMYTDVLLGKIENWVTGLGGLGGLAYTCAADGIHGVWNMGKLVGPAFLCLLVLYGIRGLGGGDVKLLVMTGIWIPQHMVSLVFGAFFLGALYACGRMVLRWMRGQPVYIRKETIPFAVPIACSFVQCMVLGGRI